MYNLHIQQHFFFLLSTAFSLKAWGKLEENPGP
jgi:hypothetical protein